MPNRTTGVAHASWLHRAAHSIAGVFFGLICIVGSCVLLFWNEDRAVELARAFIEGEDLCIPASAAKLDPANEGKLIHIAGPLAAGGPAVDSDFAVTSSGVRLVRVVRMYQWRQEEQTQHEIGEGGSEKTKTTYKYALDWVDHPVVSAKFHEPGGHENPPMVWKGRETIAPNVKLGAYAVPDQLLESFGNPQPLAAGDAQLAAARAKASQKAALRDGVIWIAENPDKPAIGDYQISFSEVPLQTASVVARQDGNGLGAYRTEAGQLVKLISAGEVPAAAMFNQDQDEDRLWIWALRAVGSLMMLLGFALCLGPFRMLAVMVPQLGHVVGAGPSIIGLLCTVALAPLVISIAWFGHRPLLAIAVLVAGAALTTAAVYLVRQRKPRQLARD